MALVVTRGKARRVGKNIVIPYNCAFDASYPTGGEALPASGVGSGLDDAVSLKQVNVVPDATHFYLYDEVNDKLAAWTAGAEVADTTDLSAKTSVKMEAVLRKQ